MLFLKLFKESIILALHALLTNKQRTALSLLGITIGIFAIISVFTAVDSLEMNVRDSIESLGNDVVFIQKWPWGPGEGEYQWWEYISRPNTQRKELPEIQKKCSIKSMFKFEFPIFYFLFCRIIGIIILVRTQIDIVKS